MRSAASKATKKKYNAAYLAANRKALIEWKAAYRAANKEIIKKRAAKYNAAHKEENRKREAAYKAAHHEKLKKGYAVYRAAHKETIKKQKADHRAANKEVYKKRQAAYLATPQGRIVARRASARRRAREAAVVIGDLTLIEAWEKTWRTSLSVRCHWCSETFLGKHCHADHVVPISRGGAHSIENLVVACSTCNLKKYNKAPEVFAMATNGRRPRQTA